MSILSHLVLNKLSIMDNRLAPLWNNLINAVSIVNGIEPPSSEATVNNRHVPHIYMTSEFNLVFHNTAAYINIEIRCNSGVTNNLDGVLEIIAATTSAVEYVVDRDESIEIEIWNVLIGSNKYEYQDVGVDSMASVMGNSREDVIDFLENHVEPKLDEIEKNCL